MRFRAPSLFFAGFFAVTLIGLTRPGITAAVFGERGPCVAQSVQEIQKQIRLQNSARLLANLPSPIRERLVRLLIAGQQRGFDQHPLVQYLTEAVSTQGSFKYTKDTWVIGSTHLHEGQVTVSVDTLIFDVAKDMELWDVDIGRPVGISYAFARAVYGLLQGINKGIARNSSIHTVRINADLIANKQLSQMLKEMGFKANPSPSPELKRLESAIGVNVEYLTLEIKVFQH